MILHLVRDVFDSEATLGTLAVDGLPFAFVCEDQDRGLSQGMPLSEIQRIKVAGETAIPAGLYRVVLEDSPKYGADCLTVADVPGYRYIRIHAGNTEADTAGCLLPGLTRSKSRMSVYKSRLAVTWLQRHVSQAIHRGEEVWIDIGRDATAWAEYRRPS